MEDNGRITIQVELRKPLAEFAYSMEQVLKENDYKGGWSELSYPHLLARLDRERDELLLAIHDGLTAEEIKKECCDVANFAMMIFDWFNRR